MAPSNLDRVANAAAKGTESAAKVGENQQMAQPPGTFDVWKHTGDGMQERYNELANDPARAAAYAAAPGVAVAENLGNATLGAVEAAAAYGVESASWGDMTNSMSAQWNAMSENIAKISQAEGFLPTLGATFGALTALEQLISTPFAMIPFPAFPALRILDMDVGLPHVHSHPPNVVPPAPPIPLPSTGPIIPIPILSGAATVLINGMPAGRCGDMGASIWCGSYFPLYEIFLGSASVWIEGARAGRLLCDVTKHCIFTYPPKPMPSDPPITPTIWGTTIMGSGNVMIGGCPMPSLVSAALGAAFKLFFKGMGKLARWAHKQASKSERYSRFARRAAERGQRAKAALRRLNPFNRKRHCPTDPTDPYTGDFYETFIDYELRLAFPVVWARHYNSARADVAGPLGRGFRHTLQRTLRKTATVFVYELADGEMCEFSLLTDGQTFTANDGLVLREISRNVYQIDQPGQPTFEFHLNSHNIGRLKAVVEGHRRVSLLHNAAEQLVGLQDSNGNSVSFVYDDKGRITQVDSHRAGLQPRTVARYEYDKNNCLVAWQDAIGNRGTYTYDSAGRMTRRTDRNGFSFHYRYDSAGRCVHAFGDDGIHDCRIEYDTTNHITIFDYSGARWEHRFSPDGQLLEIIDPMGGSTRFEIDDDGRTVAEIDPLGNVTRLIYDTNGRNVAMVDPNGRRIPSLLDETRPPDPYEETLPDSPIEWELGKLLEPGGFWTPERAQARREAIRREMPSLRDIGDIDPHTVDEAFAAKLPPELAAFLRRVIQNRPKEVTIGQPHIEYDGMNQVLEESTPDGRACAWRYDANGNVTAFRDADGKQERYEYGGFDLRTHIIDALGNTTRFKYSPREEITHVIDPAGAINQYAYDHKERLIEVRRHGRVRERYEYDAADNVVRKTDGNGVELVSLEYAPGNLLRSRKLASGETQSFEYDDHGRITKAATDQWEIAKAYDDNGLLLEDKRNNEGIEHRYRAGHLIESALLAEFVVRYDTDVVDHGTRIVSDPTGRTHRFRMSHQGMAARELANGSVELVRYDTSGRCVQKTVRSAVSAETLHDQEFVYSPGGRLLEVRDSDLGTIRYEYDAAGRLTAEVLPDQSRREYEYDAAGNLLRLPGVESITVTDGNRILAADDETFRFNERDHIGERSGPNGRWTYEYDSRDMLIAATNGKRWTASYDPLGRRMAKTYDDATTEFFWDGFRLAAERFADGRLRHYVYADVRALVPFMFVEYKSQSAPPETGTPYYIFTNHIGVPVRVEDEQGRTVWRAQVEPYGRVRVQAGSRIDLSLRFPGHYYDAETGLHYNRWRYYDPALGRFIQSDPLGLIAGTNLYAYSSSPLTEVDLTGLMCEKAAKANKAAGGRRPTGPDVETPGAPKKPNKMTPEEVKASGIKSDDIDGIEEMARQKRPLAKHPEGNTHPDGTPVKHEGRIYVIRDSNPASAQYHGQPGHVPKPLDCKLKTAKDGPNAGLVTDNQNWADPGVKKNWEKLQSDGWRFDDNGVLRDPKGNKVHGDYDLQGVYDKWDDGSVTPVKTNDPAFQSQVNEGMNGGNPPMFQHGANDDYWPNGREPGKEPGRYPDNDEQYTWIDPDGSKHVGSTEDLKKAYEDAGIEWPYGEYPRPAAPPEG
ncbi:MAG: hypothetical protein Kow0074_08560 [Candidatus Zixiibacteriota bacterium]